MTSLRNERNASFANIFGGKKGKFEHWFDLNDHDVPLKLLFKAVWQAHMQQGEKMLTVFVGAETKTILIKGIIIHVLKYTLHLDLN